MDFLESIFDATGFNSFLDCDFRPFILKTFLFSAMLAGLLSALYILCRFLYLHLYHIFRNDRRNKNG